MLSSDSSQYQPGMSEVIDSSLNLAKRLQKETKLRVYYQIKSDTGHLSPERNERALCFPAGKFLSNDLCNPLSSLPIAIGVLSLSHSLIADRAIQQFLDLGKDFLSPGADQFYRSGPQALRPFRDPPHYQDRLPQGWTLLLDPAGICQDQRTLTH